MFFLCIFNLFENIEESLSQNSSDQGGYIKNDCDSQPMTINVITKEQKMNLEFLNTIEDFSVKIELYEIFRKFVHKPESKKSIEILTRFYHNVSKEATIKDLQEEIRQYKLEVQELKQCTNI